MLADLGFAPAGTGLSPHWARSFRRFCPSAKMPGQFLIQRTNGISGRADPIECVSGLCVHRPHAALTCTVLQ
jgi:hypothetical protein